MKGRKSLLVKRFIILTKYSCSKRSVLNLWNSITILQKVQQTLHKAILRITNSSFSSCTWLAYSKFRLTYRRIIVCGFSRSQKLGLCSHILQNELFEYEFSNNIYPDLSCRRLPVPFSSRGVTVPVFRCPTPHRKLGKYQVPLHVPISYYLSSTLYPQAAIMYHRYVGHRVGIIPFSTLRSIPPNLMAIAEQDRIRAYERDCSAVQFYHDVAPYYIQKRTPSIIRVAAYAETQLSYYIKYVLQNNLTYSKFQMAFNSVNVCKLNISDDIKVCGKAFNGNEHGYDSTHYVPLKCKKVLISFPHTDIRATWVHVISCGSTFIFDSKVKSFHVSSSIQKNAVLTHVRYDPHVEVLPEAAILNVSFENVGEWSRDFVKQQASKKRKLSSIAHVPKGPQRKRIKT